MNKNKITLIMDRKALEACLQDALRPDSTVRKTAEGRILGMQSTDFMTFILALTEIFCDVSSDDQLKMIAGIILKNSFHANDAELQNMCGDRWLRLDSEVREHVKGEFKKALGGHSPRFCVMAGAVLGQIARIEISRNLYRDFFDEMRRMVCKDEATCGVCEAVGVCCNYLIEGSVCISGEYGQVIFDICMYPLENGNRSGNKLAGLKCFMNSMELQDIFQYKENVDRFLGSLVSIWNGGDEELIHKSMLCLNKLVTLNYKFIHGTVLENILVQYLNSFFKLGSEDMKIQAIEYWCIFAEMKDERIVDKYLAIVLPEVLKLLEKGIGYHDEIWSPHKAATSCLEMYTELKGNEIMKSEAVRNFVEARLKSEDRACVDIGAVALGSVMHEECEDYLVNIIPYLISGIEFRESKDSCLWALSRIAEYNFYALLTHLPVLLNKCGSVILEGSRFSIGAAWVMNCVFSSIAGSRADGFAKHIPEKLRKKTDASIDLFLARQYIDILNVLIKGTEIASLDDSNLRVALFSALTELVLICPPSMPNILDEFYGYISKKIEECLSVMRCATQNQLLIVEDVLSNYIGLIEAVVTAKNQKNFDELAVLFIRILDSTPTVAFGEVYIAISNLSTQFAPHMSKMLPYITRDMTCTDKFVLKSVINLVGTQASIMGTSFSTLAGTLISSLFQCLGSESTPRELKPMILSVFGDIALALEASFEPYLEMVVTLLSQIAMLDRHFDAEFVDELRKNMVQLVDCSLMAIGDSSKVRDSLPQILGLVREIQSKDADRAAAENVLGLIDDLVNIYGKNFGLDDGWVREFLYGMEKYGDAKNRRKANHTLEMLR